MNENPVHALHQSKHLQNRSSKTLYWRNITTYERERKKNIRGNGYKIKKRRRYYGEVWRKTIVFAYIAFYVSPTSAKSRKCDNVNSNVNECKSTNVSDQQSAIAPCIMEHITHNARIVYNNHLMLWTLFLWLFFRAAS